MSLNKRTLCTPSIAEFLRLMAVLFSAVASLLVPITGPIVSGLILSSEFNLKTRSLITITIILLVVQVIVMCLLLINQPSE